MNPLINDEVIRLLAEEHLYYCQNQCLDSTAVCESCSHGIAFRTACRALGTVRGKWQSSSAYTYKCSVCGYEVVMPEVPHICDKCGAHNEISI